MSSHFQYGSNVNSGCRDYSKKQCPWEIGTVCNEVVGLGFIMRLQFEVSVRSGFFRFKVKCSSWAFRKATADFSRVVSAGHSSQVPALGKLDHSQHNSSPFGPYAGDLR